MYFCNFINILGLLWGFHTSIIRFNAKFGRERCIANF